MNTQEVQREGRLDFNETTIPYHLDEVKRLCADRGVDKFANNKWAEVFKLMLYMIITDDGNTGINAEFEALSVDKGGVSLLVHAKDGATFGKGLLKEMNNKGVSNLRLENQEQGEINRSPELEEGNRIHTEISFGRLLWFLKTKYGFDFKAENLDQPGEEEEEEENNSIGEVLNDGISDTRSDLIGVYTAANTDEYKARNVA